VSRNDSNPTLLDVTDEAEDLRHLVMLLSLALEQRSCDPGCEPVRNALAAGAGLILERADDLAARLATLQENDRESTERLRAVEP
jgi:hypothetical protein